MLVWSIFFLMTTILIGLMGLGWVTGKPVMNAKFLSGILISLFVFVMLGLMLNWKLACPSSDKWFNLDCLRSSGLLDDF